MNPKENAIRSYIEDTNMREIETCIRCGDKSNKGLELCSKCKEKYRKESIIMNGNRCDLSNSNNIFDCNCNECYNNIKGYLGKKVGKTYLYIGKFAPVFLQGRKVIIERFFVSESEKTSTCECMIKLLNGKGGQISWIPREEIIKLKNIDGN